MLLVPQVYLKNGRAVRLENTRNRLFDEDISPFLKGLQSAGIEALYVHDLSINPTGHSPHLPLLKEIQAQGFHLFVGGNFRSLPSLMSCAEMTEFIVLGSIAYQDPKLVQEACAHIPGKIAVHIDVRAGKVTIPGWTAAANRTAQEYGAAFKEHGAAAFFYSDLNAQGVCGPENLETTRRFVQAMRLPCYITSDPASAADLERIVGLRSPYVEGVVLGKSFYEDRIDVGAVVGLLADLSVMQSDEATIIDE